jgi:disulfide bond formation protein DsbB
MSRRFLILLALCGSTALFLGALAFQYFGGLQPCHLCLLQRWPHRVAIGLGLVALVIPASMLTRLLVLAGGLTSLVGAGLGLYHTGVEKHWWQGPSTCTSGDVSGIKTDDLLNQIMNAPVVHCDQVAWSMFGISMASYNMLISLVLAGLWFWAASKPR